jgi:hypothetical protein
VINETLLRAINSVIRHYRTYSPYFEGDSWYEIPSSPLTLYKASTSVQVICSTAFPANVMIEVEFICFADCPTKLQTIKKVALEPYLASTGFALVN